MDVLGIFVKQPVPGRVKTRLATVLGADRACELYAAFLDDIIERYRTFADRRILCFTPDDTDARNHFTARAGGDYELWPQPDVVLGQRMEKFFQDQFASGARRVIVIGSDSPTVPAENVHRAFSLLDESDCVIGPADDGGYYLIGQRDRLWPIFHGIEWGSRHVFEQTMSQIANCSARVSLLPLWYDVDTIEDLDRLREELAQRTPASDSTIAPCTGRLLRQLPSLFEGGDGGECKRGK